jgi:hypothetical protein
MSAEMLLHSHHSQPCERSLRVASRWAKTGLAHHLSKRPFVRHHILPRIDSLRRRVAACWSQARDSVCSCFPSRCSHKPRRSRRATPGFSGFDGGRAAAVRHWAHQSKIERDMHVCVQGHPIDCSAWAQPNYGRSGSGVSR